MIWPQVLPGVAVKKSLMIGPSTISPMKPQTIDGIAASNSMTILSVSFTFPCRELRNIDRRAEPDGHGEQQGNRR